MENEQEFIDLLHERYYYKDGELFYKKDIGYRIKKDSKVGCIDINGYVVTQINKKKYIVHRLIFAMQNQYFPPLIDHIDRNKINNKIENLRESTYSENSINSGLRKDNTSGYKGVCFHTATQKWQAKIKRNNKYKWLGLFDTPEEAHQTRVEFIERELNEKHLQ